MYNIIRYECYHLWYQSNHSFDNFSQFILEDNIMKKRLFDAVHSGDTTKIVKVVSDYLLKVKSCCGYITASDQLVIASIAEKLVPLLIYNDNIAVNEWLAVADVMKPPVEYIDTNQF